MAQLVGALLIALAIATTGCDSGPPPPSVELGVSVCARCSAPIEDLSWAAADRRGESFRLFDEPGCLLATLRAESGTGESALFQDRAGTGAWISAADVWLARSAGFTSPQGTGWAAFPSFAAAQDAVTASGNGEILRIAEALRASAAKH